MQARRESYSMTVKLLLLKFYVCFPICALLFWGRSAQARTVAVVYPHGAEPTIVETVARVRGELLAVGLRVHDVERRAPWVEASSSARVIELQQRERLDAVISIPNRSEPPLVDVWVFESSAEAPHVTRVSLEPGTENAPEKLAIRAIDVLRSTFLELDIQNQARSGPTEVGLEPDQTAVPEVGGDATTVGLAAGLAMLTGFDGVKPAVMPTARIDLALNPTWTLQVAAAGLGTRPSLDAASYGAQIQQVYAVFGARYRFDLGRDWRPFGALSAGILSTSVEGRADFPGHAQNQNLRSLLVEGSLGADWAVFDDYYFSLAAHLHLAAPSANVIIVDSVVATTGRPNLALTFTFGTWL